LSITAALLFCIAVSQSKNQGWDYGDTFTKQRFTSSDILWMMSIPDAGSTSEL